MTQIPVLQDDKTRDRYDSTWILWPWEHPAAYWLRSNGSEVVCTRCGRSTMGEPRPLDADPMEQAEAFTRTHLKCPLGFGLRGSKPEDPLFATP